MADFNAPIKPKKSSTASEVPQASDLDVAEIAINTADGLMWTKHTDGSIVQIGGTGGGGGSTTLSGLTDTTITSPTNGQVLKYNGSAWINDTDATGGGGGSIQTASDFDLNQTYIGDTLDSTWDTEKMGARSYYLGAPTYQTTVIEDQPLGPGQWYCYSEKTVGVAKLAVWAEDDSGNDFTALFQTLENETHSNYSIILTVDNTQYGPAVLQNIVEVPISGGSYAYFEWTIGNTGLDPALFNRDNYDYNNPFPENTTPSTITKTIQVQITTNAGAVGTDIPLAAGDYLKYDSNKSSFVPSKNKVTDITDVNVSGGLNNGDILAWDKVASEWKPASSEAAVTTLTDASFPTPQTIGEVLAYDGYNWVASDAADMPKPSIASLADSYHIDGDPYYNQVSFLLKGNEASGSTTVTDSKGGLSSINPVGSFATTNEQAWKGDCSMDFRGRCEFADNDAAFDLGSGDWTVEWFTKVYLLNANGTVLFSGDGDYAGTDYAYQFWIAGNNVIGFDYTTDGQATTNSRTTTGVTWGVHTTPSIFGDWDHWAVVRKGSTLKAFQNGHELTVASGSTTINATIWNSSANMLLGASLGGVSNTIGNTTYHWIDNIRITKGKARYNQDFPAISYDFAETQAAVVPANSEVLAWNDDNVRWEPTNIKSALGIGEYSSDAAAGSGGVTSGALYYNTTSSDYRLKS